MPIEKHLSCSRGEDVTLTLAEEAGVDISGWTHKLRLLDADGNEVLTKTSAPGGGIEAGASNDKKVATITRAETDAAATADAPAAAWDWWRVDPGSYAKLGYGSFPIRGGPPPT